MELTLQLEDSADISFLKQLLSQIKGVKSISLSESSTDSWEDIERSAEFKNAIQKSRNQIKNGQYVEHSQELMDSISNK